MFPVLACPSATIAGSRTASAASVRLFQVFIIDSPFIASAVSRGEASRFPARRPSCKSNRAASVAREEFPDERREETDGVSESEDRARRSRERDSESRARDQNLERAGDSSRDARAPA